MRKQRATITLALCITLTGLSPHGAFAQDEAKTNPRSAISNGRNPQADVRVGVNPSKRVTLTLRDAMTTALENNRDIEVERLNVQMNEFDVRAAQGVYDPTLATTLYYDRRSIPATSIFAADKTDPGAFNLPLYLAFSDPMYCPGLMLSPSLFQGFRYRVIDVNYTEKDRVIELDAPEDLYNLAALLRDNERFVVESIASRGSGKPGAGLGLPIVEEIAKLFGGTLDLADGRDGRGLRVTVRFPAPVSPAEAS